MPAQPAKKNGNQLGFPFFFVDSIQASSGNPTAKIQKNHTESFFQKNNTEKFFFQKNVYPSGLLGHKTGDGFYKY